MNAVQPKASQWLERDGRVVLVTILSTQGSSPREAGTRMVVAVDGGFTGTIGGGTLEWQALAQAQKMLAASSATACEKDILLGPALGQCCGGRVRLRFEMLLREAASRLSDVPETERPMPILLFGAGHVGRALVLALAPLPFAIRWVDPRVDAFPALFPQNTQPITTGNPVSALHDAEPGSAVLVMTHSHALDFELIEAALRQENVSHIGLIGSMTKRARFESRLAQAGHDAAAIRRIECPIGLPDLGSKAPAVIAAGLAAHLLVLRAREHATMKRPKTQTHER